VKNLFTSFIVIALLVLVAVVMSAGRVTAWVLMHVVPYVAIVVSSADLFTASSFGQDLLYPSAFPRRVAKKNRSPG